MSRVSDKRLTLWTNKLISRLAIRAMREAARVWGDDDKRYLSAAVTFVDNFLGWTF